VIVTGEPDTKPVKVVLPPMPPELTFVFEDVAEAPPVPITYEYAVDGETEKYFATYAPPAPPLG
jgi:hypothetical protein